MISTIRLGQWGYYALRQSFGADFSAFSRLSREAQSRSDKTNVRLRNRRRSVAPCRSQRISAFASECLFCPTVFGQYLSCLMKCVGAKCTRLCCRVWRLSAVLQLLTAMRSELFGAVHFLRCPRLIYHPLCICRLWKSMKGGLCGINDSPHSVRV